MQSVEKPGCKSFVNGLIWFYFDFVVIGVRKRPLMSQAWIAMKYTAHRLGPAIAIIQKRKTDGDNARRSSQR